MISNNDTDELDDFEEIDEEIVDEDEEEFNEREFAEGISDEGHHWNDEDPYNMAG